MFWSNQQTRLLYGAFYNHAQNIITLTDRQVIDPAARMQNCSINNEALVIKCKFFKKKQGDGPNSYGKQQSGVVWESFHRRLFLTAIDTWKFNKTIGNGIKSFRHDCHRLRDQFDVSTDETLIPGMKNRLCANHPHNYYLEILTETGVVGVIIILLLILSILSIVMKNYKFINEKSFGGVFFLSVTVSLALEAFPIRSTGSIFSSNSATYLMLILGIFLCYEKILSIKTE